MGSKVYLGLGSNKGNREEYLKNALLKLFESGNEIKNISSVYETSPYGKPDQNNFLNAVVEIETKLDLKDLLKSIKLIEKELGRTISEKWGPREIDIDLLLYDNLKYSDNEVTVPHPEITLRDFVLIPLMEIGADTFHPVIDKKIKEIDTEKLDKHIITKFSIDINNILGK